MIGLLDEESRRVSDYARTGTVYGALKIHGTHDIALAIRSELLEEFQVRPYDIRMGVSRHAKPEPGLYSDEIHITLPTRETIHIKLRQEDVLLRYDITGTATDSRIYEQCLRNIEHGIERLIS